MNIPPYSPPPFMKNGHIQTIYPALFRRVSGIAYTRERIFTMDHDFLDLDWSLSRPQGFEKGLAVISHGLEGNTTRAYVTGMVRALNRAGWDVLAWNYRSCSGMPNLKLRSYHNGATDDLDRVIEHGKKKGGYKQIFLVGFSLGGNLTLVHLGRDRVDEAVKKAVVFSVPCDLAASARALARPSTRVYMKRFLIMLRKKIQAKMIFMPHRLNDSGYESLKNFKDFDDRYTAPIHGFKDARDYWNQCSSRQFIPDIKVPTLMVNALNDPFLAPECYPVAEAAANQNFTLEIPPSGGHVGFISIDRPGGYWSEQRAVAFFGDRG